MYVEMTMEQAIKYVNDGLIDPNTKILISTQSLEKNEWDIPFVKKTKTETIEIIQKSKSFAKLEEDDFIKKLKVFSEKQNIHRPKRKGELNVILLR